MAPDDAPEPSPDAAIPPRPAGLPGALGMLRSPWLRGLARRLRAIPAQRYLVYLGFLAVLATFSVTLRDEGFTRTENLVNVLEQTAPITIMAVATVFVLSAGEIDLSIGSVVALSSLVAAVVLRDGGGMALAVAAGLGTGLAVGLVNGVLVTRLRLPSFLVTLGMLGLVEGCAQRITNLQSVPILDERFTGLLGAGSLFGVSSLIVWTIVVGAFGHYVFRHTRTGAHVLATGDNASSARVSGIRVDTLRMGVLAVSGVAAALAGLLYAGRLEGATYTLGSSDLLTVIAAVVIGGTRLFGGSGTVIGAIFGSLLLGYVNNGLILSGLTTSEQLIAQGVIILLGVALTLREPRT